MSETEETKLTVARALVKLKTSNERIEKGIEEFGTTLNPYTHTVGDKGISGYASVDEYEEHVKSRYESLLATMTYRDELKKAIVQSNGVTKITVGGEEMTVATAIERKKTIQNKIALQQTLKRCYTTEVKEVERLKREVENTVQNNISNVGVDVTKATKSQHAKDIVEAVTKMFDTLYEINIIDPIGIVKKIDELDEEIIAFLEEVDFAITESNSTTYVEIPGE